MQIIRPCRLFITVALALGCLPAMAQEVSSPAFTPDELAAAPSLNWIVNGGNLERRVSVAASDDPVPERESRSPNKLRSK